jgi:hypothetical protein
MTAAIALRCSRCGRETDTDHSRKTVCIECLVREAVAVDLASYARQWAKKRRYERYGRLRFNPEIINRLSRRINAQVHALVSGPKAIEFFNQLLHEARAKAELTGGSRLVVAQPGDLLRKQWPDGVRTVA